MVQCGHLIEAAATAVQTGEGGGGDGSHCGHCGYGGYRGHRDRVTWLIFSVVLGGLGTDLGLHVLNTMGWSAAG